MHTKQLDYCICGKLQYNVDGVIRIAKWNDPEVVTQKCSWEKVFWKYAANLQENTHVEVWLQSNFIEVTLQHVCSPVNLLHIFRKPFLKNTSEWLLLNDLKILHSLERDSLVKLSKLNDVAVSPIPTERQPVSTCLKVH